VNKNRTELIKFTSSFRRQGVADFVNIRATEIIFQNVNNVSIVDQE